MMGTNYRELQTGLDDVAGLTNDYDKVIDTPTLVISGPLGPDKILTEFLKLSKSVP